jgi:hypothetical protein
MGLNLPCPDHTTLSRRKSMINGPHWKRESGYYRQSHAENAFFRYKTILGGRLRAKRSEAQEREVAIACAVLNRMLELGRPQSYPDG